MTNKITATVPAQLAKADSMGTEFIFLFSRLEYITKIYHSIYLINSQIYPSIVTIKYANVEETVKISPLSMTEVLPFSLFTFLIK